MNPTRLSGMGIKGPFIGLLIVSIGVVIPIACVLGVLPARLRAHDANIVETGADFACPT